MTKQISLFEQPEQVEPPKPPAQPEQDNLEAAPAPKAAQPAPKASKAPKAEVLTAPKASSTPQVEVKPQPDQASPTTTKPARVNYKLAAHKALAPALLDRLNPEQREAAAHIEGPLLILAGAGSGKTGVITHRVAHLILNEGVFPDQIVAVTFTNKAAQEMRERVDHLLDEHGQGHASSRVTISTFHSLGAKLLRRHADRLGLRWSFNIYDDSDQQKLLRDLATRREAEDKQSYMRRMRSYIERMKNRGLTPKQAHEQAYNAEEEENAFFYEDYQKALRLANCLDFGDLLLGVLEVFRADPKLASSYSRQWRFVMVDEFQDTNPAQYELLRHLTSEHSNMAVVGDDDQAIYRWRGATIANIMGFEGDFKRTKVVKLEQNYRSSQIILNAADDVIKLNPGRRDKKLWTDRAGGEPIICFTGTDDREEAVYVADKIRLLVHRGANYNDCAIFFRTNAQARQFEEQLRYAGVPYRIIGGMSFYQREEIKDVLAYLKVALNPENNVDLLRVINVPSRAVGDATADKLLAGAAIPGIDTVFNAIRYVIGADMTFEGELALIEPAPITHPQDMALVGLEQIRPAQVDGLRDFHQAVQALRDDLVHYEKLGQVIQQFLERINYMAYLEAKHPDAFEDKAHNVSELVNALEEFEQDFVMDEELGTFLEEDLIVNSGSMLADSAAVVKLRAFLDESALIQSSAESDDVALAGAVTMMTVHGSKGLEFQNVFLAGMEEDLFPSIRDRHDPEEEHEERRLAYVAITRAKERLFITNAKRRRHYGQFRDCEPSRFVLNIDKDRLEIDKKSVEQRVDWTSKRKPRFNFPQNNYDPDAVHFNNETTPGFGEFDQTRTVEQTYEQSGWDEFSQLPVESWEQPTGVQSMRDRRAKARAEGDLTGKTVTHASFGIGKVLAVSGEGDKAIITVSFPTAGQKKIVRKFLKVLG